MLKRNYMLHLSSRSIEQSDTLIYGIYDWKCTIYNCYMFTLHITGTYESMLQFGVNLSNILN